MSTLLYSHPVCLEHDPGTMHPECPARLEAVLDGLNDDRFSSLKRCEAPQIDLGLVEMVHKPYYVEKVVRNSPDEGRFSLDPDTFMSPGSLEAVRRASGAAVEPQGLLAARRVAGVFSLPLESFCCLVCLRPERALVAPDGSGVQSYSLDN